MLATGWRGLCEWKSERIILLAPHDLTEGSKKGFSGIQSGLKVEIKY